MADQSNVYLHRHPGDLLTAEDWNDLQSRIQADIARQIQQAKVEIQHAGVDRAGNADRFDNKGPQDWTTVLDQRYAQKVHDHEGLAAYRRFIKEFDGDRRNCLLQHNLGRFPLVDVYELLPVVTNLARVPADEQPRYANCRLLFYASHADIDRLDLWVRSGRDRVPLGIPFEQMLQELNLQYDEARSIEDLIGDMQDAFIKDPNDEIAHCTTPWMDDCCERSRTVGDLKRAGLWDNLHVALRPRKCGRGTDDDSCQIEIRQVNYTTVYVEALSLPPDNQPQIWDLMFLLRS